MPTLLLSFPERQQPPVHRTFDYGPLVGLPRFVRFALCGEIPAISAIRSPDEPDHPMPGKCVLCICWSGGALACDSESVGNGPVTKALFGCVPGIENRLPSIIVPYLLLRHPEPMRT